MVHFSTCSIKIFRKVSIKEVGVHVTIEPANVLNHIVGCEMACSAQYFLDLWGIVSQFYRLS